MIKLLLVDDHAVVRSGLHMILDQEEDVIIVGEAENASEAYNKTQELLPDVVLMDIGLPDMTGIEITKKIKENFPEVAIVALTIHEDEEYFFKMLEAGATGYLPKRAAPGELLTAIRAVSVSEVYIYPSLAKLLVKDFLNNDEKKNGDNFGKLTDREIEVLAYLADGVSNQEIAVTLHISPKTVSRHRENIMRKLDLRNRSELVKYAIRKGIIEA
ncbi:MAG: response regulator transcription factor [Chloroflexi bacterium]|nr:response regulator transcription factor [Chloroflexota bacterium]MBT4533542.1 response regulator transcription factor [Chloroflexota bacterium]